MTYAKIAKKLLDKGETKLAQEVLTLAADKNMRAIARKLFKSPRVKGILVGILKEQGLEIDPETLDYEAAIEGLALTLSGEEA